MKKTIACVFLALLLLCPMLLPAAASAGGDFTVSRAFSDNMILQRDQKVAVWGWSESVGATVNVTFGNNISASGTVDAAGEWTVYLPAMSASAQPRNLTVTMNGNEKIFRNVLVGDVWFVSGQSNAQLPLSYSTVKAAYPDLSKEFSDDSITRFFYQGEFVVAKDRALMKTEQKDVLESPWSKWMKETDAGFDTTALGYFFAKKVAKESGVPIGVVCIAYNGAPMTVLMPKESCTKLGITSTPYDQEIYPIAGAYNALAAPFLKMGIKGMLFYQGEGDQFDPAGVYEKKVVEYVSAMRERFGRDFPFYNVQLSSHAGGESNIWTGLARMRTRQYALLSAIPNSGLVVSMDVGAREGSADWAHPGEKKPVGERLAALALARDYKIGKESEVTSPVPASARVTEDGKAIEVTFANVGSGLKQLGSSGELLGFYVKKNSTDALAPATATIISKDTVRLTVKRISRLQDVTVVYAEQQRAFSDHATKSYVANLGNSFGLPAPAFRFAVENRAEETTPETTAPETAKPTETTKPAATTKPTETAKPAETAKPTETKAPGTEKTPVTEEVVETEAVTPDVTPETETLPETEAPTESADAETALPENDTETPEETADAPVETAGGDETPPDGAPVGLIIGIIAAVILIGGGAAALFLLRRRNGIKA